MKVIVSAGCLKLLEVPQQVWRGGEMIQTAQFAGKQIMAITDDEGAFELLYLDFQSSKFSTIESAKVAAPAFAIAVLSHMTDLVEAKIATNTKTEL